MESLHIEDDTNETSSDNMAPVLTEEDFMDACSEFDIGNPRFPKEGVFFP